MKNRFHVRTYFGWKNSREMSKFMTRIVHLGGNPNRRPYFPKLSFKGSGPSKHRIWCKNMSWKYVIKMSNMWWKCVFGFYSGLVRDINWISFTCPRIFEHIDSMQDMTYGILPAGILNYDGRYYIDEFKEECCMIPMCKMWLISFTESPRRKPWLTVYRRPPYGCSAGLVGGRKNSDPDVTFWNFWT